MNNIFLDKNYSKLGDSIVNVIGSIVKTKLYSNPTGIRIKDKVLSNALRIAGLRNIFPKRLSTGEQGDIVEAIIAYLWLHGKINIDVAVKIVREEIEKELERTPTNDSTFEEFLFAKGFARILITFSKEILQVVKHSKM